LFEADYKNEWIFPLFEADYKNEWIFPLFEADYKNKFSISFRRPEFCRCIYEFEEGIY
jgi:hypothetical protein